MYTTDDLIESDHYLSEEDEVPLFKPFEIVLVDIQRTVTDDKTYCVKKRLVQGIDLKYVAISYRWGELPEQLAVTPDYDAHITSFNKSDFVNLCKAISKEADLHTMQYVWVDAICVDQVNEDRRRKTIYHMSEIYECANWILAVPDLHLAHLRKDKQTNHTCTWIKHNAEYIYHIIMQNGDRVEEMDDRWLEQELEVPKHLRCHLRSRLAASRRDPFLLEDKSNQEDREKKLFEELMQLETAKDKENDPLNYWHVVSRMNGWQRKIDDRDDKLERVFNFFEYQVDDWSNRVWVISEYSIAKKKNSAIKSWFVSLTSYMRFDSDPTFTFFSTYTKGDPSRAITKNYFNWTLPVTNDSMKLGLNFVHSFQARMCNNRFFRMLLRSKASKNSDRFNAILPLFRKYRRYIKDKDTVKNWEITDMVSVRMRVRQWLTASVNIALLYINDPHGLNFLLPSFDCGSFAYDHNETILFHSYKHPPTGIHCNYDLLSSSSSALIINDRINQCNAVTSGDDQSCIPPRYSIHLFPKFYQAKAIVFKKDISHIICDRVWKTLSLDISVDPLTWLHIPWLIKCEGPMSEKTTMECFDPISSKDFIFKIPGGCVLDLIGSRSKNVWVVVNPKSELRTTQYVRSLNDWVWCQHGADELCIY